jgi:deoxyribonuclease V
LSLVNKERFASQELRDMVIHDANEFSALRQIQINIAKQVVLEDPATDFTLIGAVAQSFDDDRIFSSAVIVDADLKVIDESASITKTDMPYIPGLLFFHEGPAAIATIEKLHRRPDVIIVHGCGINHPRFAGLASHIGVILDMATVGVSKKALCGDYVEPDRVGCATTLTFKGAALGFVLKPMVDSKPIFISPGNNISLHGALRVVRHCMMSHRLPEPLRLAQIKAKRRRSEARARAFKSL